MTKPKSFFCWWSTRLLTICLVLCHRTVSVSSLFKQSVTDSQFMTRAHSPYYIHELIEIEKTGSLNIESGVVINFHPGAGILVKGALIAKVFFVSSFISRFSRGVEIISGT